MFLQEVEAITLELEELKREHASNKQQLDAVNEAIKAYEGQIEMMAAEVAKNKVRIIGQIREIKKKTPRKVLSSKSTLKQIVLWGQRFIITAEDCMLSDLRDQAPRLDAYCGRGLPGELWAFHRKGEFLAKWMLSNSQQCNSQ